MTHIHAQRLYSLILSFFLLVTIKAQDLAPVIKLKNGSFEDTPYIGRNLGKGPRGWNDCGKPGETAPDVHPAPGDSAFFNVRKRASHGKTYLGMVVRDNVTWEAVSQRLRTPMLRGQCYNFSIELARSNTYLSSSKTSDGLVEYTTPAVLRVWGGNGFCSKMEMLAETDAIENTDWRTYNLRLEPSRNYSTFLLEVFYKTPVFVEYNGNVLLDNASNLIPVPCDEAPLPAIEDPNDNTVATIDPIPNSSAEKPKDNDDKKTQPKETPKPKEKPIIEEKVEPTKKEHVKELNEEVVIGQEITLKNLYFDADSSVIKKRFFSVLDDVYSFLIENKNVVVEIGGHTNNRCEDAFCNMLSEKRAKAVADYLVAKGIDPKRVEHKGYGKTKPRYPNNTPTNRRRNQRVELKILSK